MFAIGRIRNYKLQYSEKDVERCFVVEIARWKSFCHNARKSIAFECVSQRWLQRITSKRIGQAQWDDNGRPVAARSIQPCFPVLNWNWIHKRKGKWFCPTWRARVFRRSKLLYLRTEHSESNDFSWLFRRNGLFWMFTLAYRCLMSTAIHASVNILSKHFAEMKCKTSKKIRS